MFILILSKHDYAGVMQALATGIRMHGRQCLHAARYSSWLDYPVDMMYSGNEEAIREAYSQADHVHFNDCVPGDLLSMFNLDPALMVDKTSSMHHHGTHLRSRGEIIGHSRINIVSTPDLLRYFKKKPVYFLQNGINQDPGPVDVKWDELSIFHSRARRSTISAYERHVAINYGQGSGKDSIKNSHLFQSVCKAAGIKHQIAYKLSNKKLLEECRQHNAVFDQVYLGIYGVSLIEAMANGQACLARIDDYSMEAYLKLGTNFPIINVDERQLGLVLEDFQQHPEKLQEWGMKSRLWFEEVHATSVVGLKFLHIISGEIPPSSHQADPFLINGKTKKREVRIGKPGPPGPAPSKKAAINRVHQEPIPTSQVGNRVANKPQKKKQEPRPLYKKKKGYGEGGA